MSDANDQEGLLVLETINPNDMTEEDLIELGNELRREVDIRVGIGYEDQFGSGVSWHEVLHLWLPNYEFFKDKAWEIVLGIVLENLRRRFKGEGNDRRPKTLIVRDPQTGEVLAHYDIEAVDAEAILVDPDQSPRRRPRIRRKLD